MGKKKSNSNDKITKKNSSPSSEGNTDKQANKPRNLLVTDATQPFSFSFPGRFATHYHITVHQTPAEKTWPGGALWDLGVLLARVVVGLSGGTEATSTMMNAQGKVKSKTYSIQLPTHIVEACDWKKILQDQAIVLELGCGVGLTGMVAAAALAAKVTVLTDLHEVIDQVTRPNIMINSQSSKEGRTIGKGAVVATPLCWGNEEDEQAVSDLLQHLDAPVKNTQTYRKKRSLRQNAPEMTTIRAPGVPHLILIGDVAYQHKPGAPSHFDALVSTLLKFVGNDTIVLFGTRIRMPASNDLLLLLLEHLEAITTSPLLADEIDPSFAGHKHNMSIHFLRKKKE